MKKIVVVIIGLVLSFGLGFYVHDYLSKPQDAVVIKKQEDKIGKTKKVIGVGGIFFKSKDPNKLNEWYKTHLGFETNEYGARFEWQEGADTTRKGSLQWCTFSETETYFSPSTKDFMINYRVENINTLVDQLKKEGVTFTDSISTYDYGKFVHIMDIDGNKIELYEPNYQFHK